MYYTYDENQKRVPVEFLYTACEICGKEVEVDIVEEVKANPYFDLIGMQRYCADCYPAYQRRKLLHVVPNSLGSSEQK